LGAIAVARKADDARLRGGGAVNAGDEPRDIDYLRLAVDAISVAKTGHAHGEARVPVAGEKSVEAGEGNSMGEEKVVNGRHRLLLILKARMPPAIIGRLHVSATMPLRDGRLRRGRRRHRISIERSFSEDRAIQFTFATAFSL
jgi:hypothetical protein